MGFDFFFLFNLRSERLVISAEGLAAEGVKSAGSWPQRRHSESPGKMAGFFFLLSGRVFWWVGFSFGG